MRLSASAREGESGWTHHRVVAGDGVVVLSLLLLLVDGPLAHADADLQVARLDVRVLGRAPLLPVLPDHALEVHVAGDALLRQPLFFRRPL